MRKLIFLLLLPASLLAQREPVLKQIDLPHPYYFREMYLPQLTSGPSWVTWSPDSKEVIYSMAGSLWRQKIDSTEAVQLTDGPGYDYQPDWSHDGKLVVYTKYDHDALELWLLDVASGMTSQLTSGGAVNVEPRWSPDGKHIAYVSTARTKHFHIFLMAMDGDQPVSIRQLTKENVSTLPRYYYSKYDHEISPAWSLDGKEIIFISNHGHIHGTGGMWRATVPDSGMIDTNTNAKEIHYEETNWKARPEFSPDGKKIVYASYLGRQWHQLWLMPSQGGDVFPLTYGDYDNINPRWSPDGKNVASISNNFLGNTAYHIYEVPGFLLTTEEGYFLRKGSSISFRVSDEKGRFVSARVALHGRSGNFIAPPMEHVYADDSFDRSKKAFEQHYLYIPFKTGTVFPTNEPSTSVTAWKGLEYQPTSAEGTSLTLRLKHLSFSAAEVGKWVSGDLHAHRNYAGTYKITVKDLSRMADAEDLGVVEDLVVNKEQRFPE